MTNISRDEGNGEVVLRIIAEEKPLDTATNTAPTLEDYYLYIFGKETSA